jgi:hypothetical protein
MATLHANDRVRGRLTGRLCTVKKVHAHDWCPDALTLQTDDGQLYLDSRRNYSRIRTRHSDGITQ